MVHIIPTYPNTYISSLWPTTKAYYKTSKEKIKKVAIAMLHHKKVVNLNI